MYHYTYDISELDVPVYVIANECKLYVLMGGSKHRLDETRVDYSIQCHWLIVWLIKTK
jgi:hypothetical protein